MFFHEGHSLTSSGIFRIILYTILTYLDNIYRNIFVWVYMYQYMYVWKVVLMTLVDYGGLVWFLYQGGILNSDTTQTIRYRSSNVYVSSCSWSRVGRFHSFGHSISPDGFQCVFPPPIRLLCRCWDPTVKSGHEGGPLLMSGRVCHGRVCYRNKKEMRGLN